VRYKVIFIKWGKTQTMEEELNRDLGVSYDVVSQSQDRDGVTIIAKRRD